MNYYHVDNLYVGVLITIKRITRKNPYKYSEISKRLIFEKLIKDGEAYYIHTLSGTFVPAKYETKTLIEGMTYADDITKLRNFYNESNVISTNEIKTIEERLNIYDINSSKLYNSNNLYIGRIYNFTMNNLRYKVMQNFSREFIFEKINLLDYREIRSRVVYQELSDHLEMNRDYVQVVPFNEVFRNYQNISEEKLGELEKCLSSTPKCSYRKILTL